MILKRQNPASARFLTSGARSSLFSYERRFTLDVRTFVETNNKDFSEIIANIRKIVGESETGQRAA